MIRSKTIIATPPGATIKEQLFDRKMSQKEFSTRMGLTEKHVSKLLNGEVKLTPEVALKLEFVLGIPAKFWNNLEAIYRDNVAKAKAENELDEEIKIAKLLPYNEMSKLGWVPETRKANERVINLKKYFEVTKLTLIFDNRITQIACRKLSETEKSDLALIAWVQKAKLLSRNIETQALNRVLLTVNLEKIRSLTTKSPEIFCNQLLQILSNCGIAIVFLPHLQGSFLHGATFKNGSKVVVGLTVRGRDADRFWFSLFHELAHIILGHIEKSDGTTEQDEQQANDFAKNILINEQKYNDFVLLSDFSIHSIKKFADSIDIDIGIVIGRLQKEGKIPYDKYYDDYKTKYVIQ